MAGILGGDLVLENLTLRKDVLQNALNLPTDYDISRGVVRELRLNIPWTRILSQSQPVLQISLRTIEIVVVPVIKRRSSSSAAAPTPSQQQQAAATDTKKAARGRVGASLISHVCEPVVAPLI